MLKKFVSLSLVLCMSLACFLTNITSTHAVENDDLSQFIVGGTGTFDDPYILSGDSPYKEMFDNMAKEAVQPTVTPMVDFSGTLTGPVYYGQTNGGIWRYTSGGQGTGSDYSLVILGISYVNNAETQVLSSVLNNTSMKQELVKALGANILASALYDFFVGSWGTSVAKAISSIFVFAIDTASVTDIKIVNEALSLNAGILEISYKTSYHGSWYQTGCLDVWRTYPTAKTPGSYYGNGVYRSK